MWSCDANKNTEAMNYDPQNIFAKILRGELPAIRIDEDEATLTIMDIMPQSDGHVLVLTKEPAVEIFDLSDEGAAACMRASKRMAAAVKKAMNAPGVVISQFNGKASGQTVPHVHFHIVPCYEGQSLRPHGSAVENSEKLQEIAARITAALG